MWIGAVIGGVLGLMVVGPLLLVMLHPRSRVSNHSGDPYSIRY